MSFDSFNIIKLFETIKTDLFGLYGQVNKLIRWMPRQLEAMKDVVTCDKPRGVCKLTLIRGFPNGETRPTTVGHITVNT